MNGKIRAWRSGFFLSFLVLFCVCTSCATPKIWGLSRDDLLRSLRDRDYAFLEKVELSSYPDILKLDPDAPWFIGQHLAQAGKETEARSMFLAGAEGSGDPFAILCLQELTAVGTAVQRLEAVDALLARLDEKKGPLARGAVSRIDPAGYEKLRIALLVETGRFADATVAASGLPAGERWYYTAPFSESLAAGFTAMLAGAPQPAADGSPVAPQPAVDGLPVADPSFREVMTVRLLVFRKDYQGAWLKAKPLLEAGTPELKYRSVLSDCGKAALYGSGDRPTDAAFLDSLAVKAAPGSVEAFMFSFYSGRLYARSVSAGSSAGAGTARTDARKARARFIEAMRNAPSDFDHDTALWYLFDLARRDGTGALVDELKTLLPEAKNPSFFSDIFEELIAALVGKADWKALAGLERALPRGTDREILARLSYINARSGLLGAHDAEDEFRSSFALDYGSLYYRVMSAAALGIGPIPDGALLRVNGFSSRAEAQNGNAGSPPALAGDEPTDADEARRVLEGLITWGLAAQVYPTALRLYPDVPLGLAMDLAGMLADGGNVPASIRVVSLALRGAEGGVTDRVLERCYPRPWKDEVRAASLRFRVPEYLLYALLRSESYFDAGIVSRSGAVGLAQLMGPTAGDVARKLGLDSYDLTDPATSITFGAYYLSELIRRLDGKYMPALFAYNAGITRVRAWLKSADGLAGDLFLESLPYAETREYGRKVLAAAVVYGYLYYQKEADLVVRELF